MKSKNLKVLCLVIVIALFAVAAFGCGAPAADGGAATPGGAAAGDGLAGIINVEDDITVAAALGMSSGIMRDPCGPYYGAVTKALVWQRFRCV